VNPVFTDTIDHFLKHRDQGYSFTDVTSFLLMRDLRIRKILSQSIMDCGIILIFPHLR